MLTKLPQGTVAEQVVTLPFTKPPLTANHRLHRMQVAKIVRELRIDMVTVALGAKLPKGLPHVWVELVYRKPTNRIMDADNLYPTLKALCDGLAAGTTRYPGYGVVKDDHPEYMTKLPPIILPPHDGRMVMLPRDRSALIISWEMDNHA